MKKIIISIIIILVIGGWMIKSSYNTDFNESDDRKTFFKTFGSWIKNMGTNVVSITGHVVDQEWKPELNETDND